MSEAIFSPSADLHLRPGSSALAAGALWARLTTIRATGTRQELRRVGQLKLQQTRPVDVDLAVELRAPVSNCLHATAEVLQQWGDCEATAVSVDTARAAVTKLSKAISEAPRTDGHGIAPGAVVVLDIERILAALSRRIVQST
ncbi:hypothetical protein ACQR35_04400 [Pseudarthrobacter sp. J1738]|uniref:hypothetical protein n=1 Tax=Pseudarthrobacter sp. J1738 TaxID=3420446 RepID=UPI003D2DD15D